MQLHVTVMEFHQCIHREACVFSFRHHTYKKGDGQVELSEVGPRFEMKGLFCL